MLRAWSECSTKCRSMVNLPVQQVAVQNVQLGEMKLLLQTTSVFDENIKMQIRNIATLFWCMLHTELNLTQDSFTG